MYLNKKDLQVLKNVYNDTTNNSNKEELKKIIDKSVAGNEKAVRKTQIYKTKKRIEKYKKMLKELENNNN